jgi:hypothetical protein
MMRFHDAVPRCGFTMRLHDAVSPVAGERFHPAVSRCGFTLRFHMWQESGFTLETSDAQKLLYFESLFFKLDPDGDGSITFDEAVTRREG